MPHSNSRSRTALLISALLLLVLAGVLLWTFRAPPGPIAATPAANGPAPVPVILAEVTEALDSAALDVLGSAAAARSVVLFPAAAGEVQEVLFRPGQRVRAEQVLLRLVDRTERLALETAAARRQAAERLLARYESTRGTGAVPGSVIDEAQSTLALARIEERRARETLSDRVLRAPFAGVVGLTDVEAGDRIGTDTPVTTLDDRATLLVGFQVPEAYAGRLQIGQPVRVVHPAYPSRHFDGRVSQIDSRIDETSRNLRLRATVPNPQDLLRPGMSFQVLLALPGQLRAAVPELALQWGPDGSYVWTVRDGRAVQVPVRSLRREGGRVLIEGPLQPGQPVVVEGVQRLRPDRAVVPVGSEAAASLARRSTTRAGAAAP